MMMTVNASPPEELIGLCATLYGDLVDPDVVWETVTKLAPGQSDLSTPSTPGANLRRNAAFAGTAAGTVIGVKELAHGIKGFRTVGGGKLKPMASLVGAGAMLGADALAVDELRPRKKGTLTPTGNVAKFDVGGMVDGAKQAFRSGKIAGRLGPTTPLPGNPLSHTVMGQPLKLKNNPLGHTIPGGSSPKKLGGIPKLDDVVSGLRRTWAEIHPPTAGLNPGAANPAGGATSQAAQVSQDKSGQRWENAGSDIGRFMSTKTGKATVGTAAVVGGVKVKRKMSPPPQDQYDYVPNAYAKRDGEGGAVDVTWEGTFSKLDSEKRCVFGWASVTKVNGTPVVDRQGDYIDTDDIEQAAYDYVHKSRVGGDMHRRTPFDTGMGDRAHKVSDMIESIVFTDDKVAKMGLPEDFPRGWWVGFKIHDDETWDLVKKGARTGFSIHGKGMRKDHDLDELMGYAS